MKSSSCNTTLVIFWENENYTSISSIENFEIEISDNHAFYHTFFFSALFSQFYDSSINNTANN